MKGSLWNRRNNPKVFRYTMPLCLLFPEGRLQVGEPPPVSFHGTLFYRMASKPHNGNAEVLGGIRPDFGNGLGEAGNYVFYV
jgi:hypothetical protein